MEEESLNAINQSKGINPDTYNIYIHLSKYYKRNGDLLKAIDSLKQSLSIAPAIIVYWICLANLYVTTGDFESALDPLTTCIEEHIEHDTLYFECTNNTLPGYYLRLLTIIINSPNLDSSGEIPIIICFTFHSANLQRTEDEQTRQQRQ